MVMPLGGNGAAVLLSGSLGTAPPNPSASDRVITVLWPSRGRSLVGARLVGVWGIWEARL